MATLKTSHESVSLTAPQLHALASAACRDDGALVLPARLRGKAAQNFVGALIEKGVAREIRAKPGMPVYRRDAETGRSYTLVTTKLGRTSSSPSQDETASPLPEAEPQHTSAAKSSPVSNGKPGLVDAASSAVPAILQNGPGTNATITELEPSTGATAPTGSNAPRSGSKLANVIALLCRETGASVEELMASTGWLPHTTRAALTGLRKRGYAILREHRDEKGSVYRIEPVSRAKAA